MGQRLVVLHLGPEPAPTPPFVTALLGIISGGGVGEGKFGGGQGALLLERAMKRSSLQLSAAPGHISLPVLQNTNFSLPLLLQPSPALLPDRRRPDCHVRLAPRRPQGAQG